MRCSVSFQQSASVNYPRPIEHGCERVLDRALTFAMEKHISGHCRLSVGLPLCVFEEQHG